MRRIVVFVSLFALLFVMSGCTKSPHAAGLAMAERHIAAGMNPSAEEKSRMQDEFKSALSKYSASDQKEFAKGYAEGIMKALKAKMGQGAAPKGK